MYRYTGSRCTGSRYAGIGAVAMLALGFLSPASGQQVRSAQSLYAPEGGGLTPPSNRAAAEIGRDFLNATASLEPADLAGVYLAQEYTTAHNGVTHLLYRQRFDGIDVQNADWVVNLAPDGSVLNAGGMLYTTPGPVEIPDRISSVAAVRAAVTHINPLLGATYSAFESPRPSTRAATDPNSVRYIGNGLGGDVEGRLVWFGLRGTLLPAWMFTLINDDGAIYSVAVDAASHNILEQQSLSLYQSAPRARVFDRGSPQPTLDGQQLTSAPAFVERVLVPLSGDPAASPRGWIDGSTPSTSGNNTITGSNRLGQAFLVPTPTAAVDGVFDFPLPVGAPDFAPLQYPDAANTNLFYWINRAHDLHYAAGFDEASGNYQANNFGRGGVGGDAIVAYTHYGASALGSPALRNAFFTTLSQDDGALGYVNMFVSSSAFAAFFTDAAYDAEVILHEYTHGVSIRLVRQITTFQGGAMGEGWSDFFAMEYLLADGAPPDGIYPVGQYFQQLWGMGIRTRPYSTRLDVNPLTYAELGHVEFNGPEVHSDGEIWAEALWEARANLIRQFGEREGRRRIRLLVIDGMKLTIPAPSMVDARDGILLADRVNFGGASQTQLWQAFSKRGLGALAYSAGGDTVHIVPSFEMPSATGQLRFHESTFVPGEPVRVILSDSNYSQPTARVQLTSSAGDLEDLVLRRAGFIYVGSMASTGNVVNRGNFTLNIGTADAISAYYFDADPASGPGRNIQITAGTLQPYFLTTDTPRFTFANEIRIGTTRTPLSRLLPFDFPFYGKKYRGMTIFPTGVITFENTIQTSLFTGGCTDLAELRRIPGIAPLFHNLTFGTAQANEGVYLSTVPGSVTVRWAAETLTGLNPNNGDPVNFAVTLNEDGLIFLHYGTGNQNLQTAAVSSACGPAPVTGISNGHGVFAQAFTLRSFTNATVKAEPPLNFSSIPVARLEAPTNDAVAGSSLAVRGYAYDANARITRVEVFVDDIVRLVTTPSVSRTDICSGTIASSPSCPVVGFQSSINLDALGLAPGPHSLWVRATNARGAFSQGNDEKRTFTLSNTPSQAPKGSIETPAANAELSGVVQFRGYAYIDTLRVARVDLLIDGLTYPGAGYGLARADICGSLAAPLPPNCPNVGWSASINTRAAAVPLPDGAHSMQLRVQDEAGRLFLLPEQPVAFTVKNGPQVYPAGNITSQQQNDKLSGVVTITGYAYNTAGASITSVSIVVDDAVIPTTVRTGLPQPEVCAALTNVPACPDIGFSTTLDTRQFTNGPHVLGVRIVNTLGLVNFVPALNGTGINVFVENPQ